MILQTKKRSYRTNIRSYPGLGLTVAVDQFKYRDKNRRTYTLFILCFVIEVEVEIYKQKVHLNGR